MTTAARLAGDRRNVELVDTRAQADPPCRPVAPRRLADQNRHVRALDGAQVVDDPFRVRLGGTYLGKVGAEQVRDDDSSTFIDLRAIQSACEKLQLRELHRLVDALKDAMDVRTCLDKLRRESQRLRCRICVLEPARIRHQRDVERFCHVRSQLDAQLTQEIADDFARRRCIRNHEVDVTEARVVVVVIDVDRERHTPEHLGVCDATLVRAVERNENAL